jgi:hypothetical protein
MLKVGAEESLNEPLEIKASNHRASPLARENLAEMARTLLVPLRKPVPCLGGSRKRCTKQSDLLEPQGYFTDHQGSISHLHAIQRNKQPAVLERISKGGRTAKMISINPSQSTSVTRNKRRLL